MAKETVTPEYWTLSPAGVMHITPASTSSDRSHATPRPVEALAEFTPLATWLHELSAYNAMRQMRLFRLYLPRKMFAIWRSAAHAAAFRRARDALQARAFCASSTFVGLVMDAARHIHDACSVPLMPFEGPKEV